MDFKKILFKTSNIDVEKALPDAVIFCTKDGKIEWINDKAAEIFETSKMHLMTSNISDFIENALTLIVTAIFDNRAVITKYVDKEVYFDMTASEVPEGYVLAFRDVQNQNNYSPQVKAIENSSITADKNEFLSKLENDFKSPLQSIIGFSQAMTDGLGGDMSEQQSKYIKIINKNSTDLMYFMSKLIELSKSEMISAIPDLKTFDIVNLLHSVSRFNQQLYKDKNINWNISIEEDIKKTIVSNEDILRIVLQNILEVILKSVDIGDINITLSVPTEEYLQTKNLLGEYHLVTISSSAMLLSENDLESLFNPYVIVDSANRKNLLRAITLACVKNLVQTLKGVIWVESKILKNTTFNIMIPQYKA